MSASTVEPSALAQGARPLKVLALTNLFPNVREPTRGVFNRQQFAALPPTISMSVVAPVDWPRWRPDLLQAQSHNGVGARYFPFFYVPRYGRRFNGTMMRLCSRWAARSWVRELQPDLVLGSWLYPDGLGALEVARLCNVPLVLKAHGSDINTMLQDRLVRRQVQELSKSASALVVVSRALADAARAADLKPRRIQVIYNGVDQNAFSIVPRGEARRRLGIADIGPTVGFVGNLKRSKGAVDAVHAYVLARRRIPTLQMLVVGRGDAEHEMREVAKLASPGGAVRFLGAQDHKSIATVMNAADVLILPSYAEGVPNVLLESQACGTPVVASRVGGVPEVVSEPLGRLVEPGNLQGFAEAIASTVAAPPERQLIRASVERFTWSRSANELAGTLLAAAASTARS